VLLGASLFTAGESLEAAGSRRGILPNDGAHATSNTADFRGGKSEINSRRN
jgi:hypothetical protein